MSCCCRTGGCTIRWFVVRFGGLGWCLVSCRLAYFVCCVRRRRGPSFGSFFAVRIVVGFVWTVRLAFLQSLVFQLLFLV